MNKLDLVENRLKSLIQKSALFFPWADKNAEIMSLLIDSIQSNILQNTSSKNTPHVFSLKMNSTNARAWQSNPSWDHDLNEAYKAVLKEFGIKQDYSPVFNLIIKNSLGDNEVLIEAEQVESSKDKTSSVITYHKKESSCFQACPILLFGDEKEIPINTSVVTIGRRDTNDIVIDDMRISRVHAQIRHIADGYMIFDAGSTGGTFVNSTRITQQLLKTGDVISLGGYRFIFLQENPRGATTPQKQSVVVEDKK